MSREKSLAKNTLIITLGKLCTQLITFFLLPLYTGVLSTKEFGTVDLLNILVALMIPIVTFQVEQAVFRELIEVRDREKEKKRIISSGVLSVFLQCLTYLLIFFIISPFVQNEYKLFLATNVIAYIFSSLFLQIARGLGKNNKYAFGSFIGAIVTIALNILFLIIIKLGAYGMLLGVMLGQVTCAIYLFISLRLYKYINTNYFNKSVIKNLWKYSIPLIPNAISWWIFSASDRVIVSTMLGIDQNGILAAASKFSIVYITLYNIFNMSWTESISLHVNDDDIDEYFSKVFNKIIALFAAIAVLMIALMPFIFPIMINEKFNSGYGLIPILIIASLFNVVVGLISVIYVAKKNTKAIANTSIISAICNIVVHLLLIKFIGLYAAVISTFISFFIMSIYRLYDIKKKYFKININGSLVIKTLIIMALVLFTFYINSLYLNFITILLSIIYTININVDLIKSMINTLIKRLKVIK